MKNTHISITLTIILIALLTASCAKKEKTPPPTAPKPQIIDLAEDQNLKPIQLPIQKNTPKILDLLNTATKSILTPNLTNYENNQQDTLYLKTETSNQPSSEVPTITEENNILPSETITHEQHLEDQQTIPNYNTIPTKSFDLTKLVTTQDLRRTTGYKGKLTITNLPGQQISQNYNAILWKTDNKNELGFALQVFKHGNSTASQKNFNDLFEQSFNPEKINESINEAFYASHDDLLEYTSLIKNKNIIVIFSCSKSLCNKEQISLLLKSIERAL